LDLLGVSYAQALGWALALWPSGQVVSLCVVSCGRVVRFCGPVSAWHCVWGCQVGECSQWASLEEGSCRNQVKEWEDRGLGSKERHIASHVHLLHLHSTFQCLASCLSHEIIKFRCVGDKWPPNQGQLGNHTLWTWAPLTALFSTDKKRVLLELFCLG
jgi:hypothetical protein